MAGRGAGFDTQQAAADAKRNLAHAVLMQLIRTNSDVAVAYTTFCGKIAQMGGSEIWVDDEKLKFDGVLERAKVTPDMRRDIAELVISTTQATIKGRSRAAENPLLLLVEKPLVNVTDELVERVKAAVAQSKQDATDDGHLTRQQLKRHYALAPYIEQDDFLARCIQAYRQQAPHATESQRDGWQLAIFRRLRGLGAGKMEASKLTERIVISAVSAQR
jgi:hypothetical protein